MSNKGFIVGMGGGGVSLKLPRILVTYPEGSVCTCTNGEKTYKAKDTSGFWVFGGLIFGNWTVTATDPADPIKTKSKTVEITTENQDARVELKYTNYYYKAGEEYADVTGGWKVVNNSAGIGSKQSDKIYLDYTSTAARNSTAYTNKKINIDDASIIKTNIQVIRNNESIVLGLTTANSDSSPSDHNGFAYSVVNTATKTGELQLELDVSEVSGEYYICVSANKAGLYITEVCEALK